MGRPKNRIKVTCLNCNIQIEKKASDVLRVNKNFCCRDCYNQYDLQKSVKCENCLCMFKTNKSRTRKYCSRKCFNQSKGYKNFGSSIVKCSGCGLSIERRQHLLVNVDKPFCSNECRLKHIGKENNPRWIKDRTKIKNQNKSLRESVELKNWRKNVFARDNWTCKLCGDRSCKGHRVVLNAHLIKKFIDNQELSANVNNGITLCEKCHKKTYQKEHLFEKQFVEIVSKTVF